MLKRTHLAVGIGLVLYFIDIPQLKNKLIFIPIVLIASLLPDIDSGFSTLGRSRLIRPVQWIFSHRGIIHTFTTCIFISALFAFFLPVIAFPFFLGYSFHLLLDSFTPQGIQPFWPLKKKSTGSVVVGGKIESTIFVLILIVDFALFIKLFL